MNFLKKPLTVKEQQTQNDRELRKASRDLDRDNSALQREEKKLEMEIIKMAKEGNNAGCKILAKRLVQLRNQKTRIYSANSKISSVQMQNSAWGASGAVAGATGAAADARVSAALDDVLNGSHDEEASEGVVGRLLDEIGLAVSGRLAKAPAAPRLPAPRLPPDALRPCRS